MTIALPGCGEQISGGLGALGASDPNSFASQYSYAEEDVNSAWDEKSAVQITLNGSTAKVEGDGAAAAGSVVTISQAGTYVLAGALDDGQILIDAGKEDVVRLVLNGVQLANSTGAPIYAKKAAKTILTLADGKENSVTDAASYLYADGEDEPDAAIFVKDSLSINGDGSLTVQGQAKDAIAAKDMLVVTGGKLTLRAVHDGLQGRDGIAIRDGVFVIAAGNDGIKANNDTDEAKGFIILDGGTYDITTGQDGIQAETGLSIQGGDYEILTGGGADAAAVKQENGFGGWARGPGVPFGTVPGTAPVTAAEAEDDASSDSVKALKAGGLLTIQGGTFNINAADDAVHTNGDMTVTGGQFAIQTGDDAFHADGALRIDGGEINVARCYEGLEGATIDINGGHIIVTASDDAINAAGGSDGGTAGPRGRDSFAAASNIYIRITGGVVEVLGGGDGIDANGDIFLEGGALYLSGPSMEMDGAVDLDGTFLITGGTMITAGTSMAPSAESTQPSLLVSYTSSQAEGSKISLKDEAGKTLLEYTSQTSYTASAMTSPEFAVGKTYALYVNEQKLTEITLSGIVTSIADDGGAYAARGPGGRGGFGGGGFPAAGGSPPADGGGRVPPTDGGNGSFLPPDGSGGGFPPAGGGSGSGGDMRPPEGGGRNRTPR
jgi:hypothetical protein